MEWGTETVVPGKGLLNLCRLGTGEPRAFVGHDPPLLCQGAWKTGLSDHGCTCLHKSSAPKCPQAGHNCLASLFFLGLEEFTGRARTW